jgi:hypothetical protein
MPSTSLLSWQNDRMPRLTDFDAQCAASLTLTPPQPNLVEENLRGCVLLLSAHFQGFCRDLYTESTMVVVSKIRPRLQILIQEQFAASMKLNHGNPNIQNLKEDFMRFGFALDLPAANPANAARLMDLAVLNKWRNIAAHHGAIPGGMPSLRLPLLQGWRNSCDGLATSLDDTMYNELRKILRRAPW